LDEKIHKIGVNFGTTFSLIESTVEQGTLVVGTLLGAGWYSETQYNNYFDNFRILGKDGSYFIETSNSSKLNILVGIVANIEQLNLRIAYETQNGISFGIGASF
jgi:hypothetical protein